MTKKMGVHNMPRCVVQTSVSDLGDWITVLELLNLSKVRYPPQSSTQNNVQHGTLCHAKCIKHYILVVFEPDFHK